MLMRTKLLQFFSGDCPLSMDVKSLPISQTEMQEQKKLRDLAIKFLETKLSEES